MFGLCCFRLAWWPSAMDTKFTASASIFTHPTKLSYAKPRHHRGEPINPPRLPIASPELAGSFVVASNLLQSISPLRFSPRSTTSPLATHRKPATRHQRTETTTTTTKNHREPSKQPLQICCKRRSPRPICDSRPRRRVLRCVDPDETLGPFGAPYTSSTSRSTRHSRYEHLPSWSAQQAASLSPLSSSPSLPWSAG